MKIIPVACAIIVQNGKVLAAQRSESMDLPGKWEFPGGKVEEGESAEDCLVREIFEEMSIQIKVGRELESVFHSYPRKMIRLLPFLAYRLSGEICLSEHSGIIWLDQESLFSLDWAEADRPLVHYLSKNWVKLVVENEFR